MPLSVIMIGATGAVGGHVLSTLLKMPEVTRITLLGRRVIPDLADDHLTQHVVSLEDPSSYAHLIKGHDCAICTLGVGQPSTMSKEAFLKIDKEMPEQFAQACHDAGVTHFELLSSVGASSKSSSFFLRAKGELEDTLEELGFERLSLFHPSMILTPENRYGVTQALTLAVWPKLHWMMRGKASSYRGIKVDVLGGSIAHNLVHDAPERVETLHWSDFTSRT